MPSRTLLSSLGTHRFRVHSISRRIPSTMGSTGSFMFKRHYASDDEPLDYSKVKIPPESLSTATPDNPEHYGVYRAKHQELYGDYPALKWIPYDQKDPYAHYDDPVNRRNFGEILHAEDEILSGTAPATYSPEPLSRSFLKIFAFFGTLGGLWLIVREVVTSYDCPYVQEEFDFPKYEGNKLLEQYLTTHRTK